MFRGTQTGSVDAKGRLKLSAAVKRRLKGCYRRPEVFITSLDGKVAKVFPIREWEEVEAQLFGKSPGPAQQVSATVRNKILFQANRFGSEERVDAQGRVRVPAMLRDAAGLCGPVKVQWQSNHMLVLTEDLFNEAVEANRLSEDDMALAAGMGL